MVSSIYYPVDPRLKPYIEYYWHLKSEALDSKTCSLLPPEACFDLIFCFADLPFWKSPENKPFRLHQSFISGMRQSPHDMICTKPVEYLAVRFHPHGLYPFLRMPLSEIVPQPVFPVDLLPDKRWKMLVEKLGNLNDTSSRIRILENELCSILSGQTDGIPEIIKGSLDRIRYSNGAVRMKTIHREMKVCPRFIEREFKKYVGIPPKAFSRIYRFSRLVNHLLTDSGTTDWMDLVFRYGYHDQPHMIREFTGFSGLSPERFQSLNQAI